MQNPNKSNKKIKRKSKKKKHQKPKIRGKLEYTIGWRTITIKISDIAYVKRNKRKVDIHLKNKEIITVKDSLQNLMRRLSRQQFKRCHKSFIVRRSFVKDYFKNKEGLLLELKNGETVLVSKKRKTNYKKMK